MNVVARELSETGFAQQYTLALIVNLRKFCAGFFHDDPVATLRISYLNLI